MRYQGASFSQAKMWWSSSTMTVRLIVVNLILFLLYHIGGLVCFFSGSSSELLLQWVELPSNPYILATRPWTLLTYMVSHYNFFHILFNLLWLFWIGTLFERTYGSRRTLLVYIWGGLAGAAAYLLVMNLLGANAWMLGASASVMAIVMATTVMMPNYTFLMFLFGPVKLKWIAIVTAVLFLIGLEGTNLGGNVAHFGGMIMGLCYGFFWLKRPHRIRSGSSRYSRPRWNIKFPKFNFSKKSNSSSSSNSGSSSNNYGSRGSSYSGSNAYSGGNSYSSGSSYSSSGNSRSSGSSYSNSSSSNTSSGSSSNNSSNSNRSQGPGISQKDQEELDKILDKIKKTGYAGLTAEEKRRLFDVSSRIK